MYGNFTNESAFPFGDDFGLNDLGVLSAFMDNDAMAPNLPEYADLDLDGVVRGDFDEIDGCLSGFVDANSMRSLSKRARLDAPAHPVEMEMVLAEATTDAPDDNRPAQGMSHAFRSRTARNAVNVAVPEPVADDGFACLFQPDQFEMTPERKQVNEVRLTMTSLAAQIANRLAATPEAKEKAVNLGLTTEKLLEQRVMAALMIIAQMEIELDWMQHEQFIEILMTQQLGLLPSYPTSSITDQRGSLPVGATDPTCMCVRIANRIKTKTAVRRPTFLSGPKTNVMVVLMQTVCSSLWRSKTVEPENLPAFFQVLYDELYQFVPDYLLQVLFKMTPDMLMASRHVARFFRSGHSILAMHHAEAVVSDYDAPVLPSSFSFLSNDEASKFAYGALERLGKLAHADFSEVRPFGDVLMAVVLYASLRYLNVPHTTAHAANAAAVREMMMLDNHGLDELPTVSMAHDEQVLDLPMAAFVAMVRALLMSIDIAHCQKVMGHTNKETLPSLPNNAWVRRFSPARICERQTLEAVLADINAWCDMDAGDEVPETLRAVMFGDHAGVLMYLPKALRTGMYALVLTMYRYTLSNAILSSALPDRSGTSDEKAANVAVDVSRNLHHVMRLEVNSEDTLDTACSVLGVDVSTAQTMRDFLFSLGALVSAEQTQTARAYALPSTDPGHAIEGLRMVEPMVMTLVNILKDEMCTHAFTLNADGMATTYGMNLTPSRTSLVMRMGNGCVVVTAVAVDPFVHLVNQSMFDMMGAAHKSLSVPIFSTYGVGTMTYLSKADEAKRGVGDGLVPQTTWDACAVQAFRVYTASMISTPYLLAVMDDRSVVPESASVIRAMLSALPDIYMFHKDTDGLETELTVQQRVLEGINIMQSVLRNTDKTISLHQRERTNDTRIIDDVMYAVLQFAVSPAITAMFSGATQRMTLDGSRTQVFERINDWIKDNAAVPGAVKKAWEELSENVAIYDSADHNSKEDLMRDADSDCRQRMYQITWTDAPPSSNVEHAVVDASKGRVPECAPYNDKDKSNSWLAGADLSASPMTDRTFLDAVSASDGPIWPSQSIRRHPIHSKLVATDLMGRIGPLRSGFLKNNKLQHLGDPSKRIILFDPADTLLLHTLIAYGMPTNLVAEVLVMMRPMLRAECNRKMTHRAVMFEDDQIFQAGWVLKCPETLWSNAVGAHGQGNLSRRDMQNGSRVSGACTNSPFTAATSVTTHNSFRPSVVSISMLTLMAVETWRVNCCCQPRRNLKRKRAGEELVVESCPVSSRLMMPPHMPDLYKTPNDYVHHSCFTFGGSMVVPISKDMNQPTTVAMSGAMLKPCTHSTTRW